MGKETNLKRVCQSVKGREDVKLRKEEEKQNDIDWAERTFGRENLFEIVCGLAAMRQEREEKKGQEKNGSKKEEPLNKKNKDKTTINLGGRDIAYSKR